jgi:hypothetical protein
LIQVTRFHIGLKSNLLRRQNMSDDLSTPIDLIIDFDGGLVVSGQGYDIPTFDFDGFNFTAFTPFAQSDGSAGDLNEQIFQIVAGVREDYANFNVRVIWDDQGVNSPFFDNTDTVVMVVAESGTSVGLESAFGIASNVDVPAFTGAPLQSRRDTAFAFLPPHIESSFEPFAYSQIRELIDTISHEAAHTFGLSHTSEQDTEARQIVTTAEQNQNLDSRFSPEILNHDAPETEVEYSETDRLNEAVGAASTLPGDTQSSQTLPEEPNTPFLGSIATTDFISQSGTVDFLGDRDAFRFVAQETGQYTIQMQVADESLLNPVVTLWDAEGDFIDVGTGTVSTITFNATADTTYYAVAGSEVDRQGSGVVPDGQTGTYTLEIGTEVIVGPYEPNDSILQAYDTGIVGSGSIVLSAMIGDGEFGQTEGDYDYFSLSAFAGQKITIHTFADVNGIDLDTVVRLYDSSGTLLAVNDDNDSSLDSSLSYDVAVDGQYFALVQGLGVGVGTTRNYEVAFTVSDNVNIEAYEPNDSIPQAYDTGISGSGSTVLSATIGDGEFGQTTGDYDYYSLFAFAGQNITIETFSNVNGTSLNTVVGLYDSFGTLVSFNNNNPSSLDSSLSYNATLTGKYYAVVQGSSTDFPDPFTPGAGGGVGSTGNYEVAFTVSDNVNLEAYEPNETISQAYNTGLSGSGSTVLSAAIGDGEFGQTTGDYDYYSLFAFAGQTITLATFSNVYGTSLDTVVGLYNSSGTLLTFNNNNGSSLDSSLSYDVAFTDQYFAVVRGASPEFPDPFTPGAGSEVGSTGNYEVAFTVSDNVNLEAYEPNDSISQAYDTGIIGSGSTVLSAVIGDGEFGQTTGDYDYFSLFAFAGQNITIDTFANVYGTSLDTVVGLYDSFGTLVASNNNNASSFDSSLSYNATLTGNYYAVVQGSITDFPDPFTPGAGGGVGSTGNYEVAFTVSNNVNLEPNDSIPQAYNTGLIGSGSTVLSAVIGDGEFGQTTGDYDYFSLFAFAGQNITIDTFSNVYGTSLDTVVGLYNSSGTLVASNDNNASSLDSSLSYDVAFTDQYFAVVRGASSGLATDPLNPGGGSEVGSTGSYEVAFTVSDEVNLEAYEPNDSISQAYDTGISGSGSTVLSAVIGDGEFGQTSGDYDYYSLFALAGQNITVDTFSNAYGTSLNTVVGLYDSSGTLVALNDNNASSFDSSLSYNVAVDGQYYAVVTGAGSGLAVDLFTDPFTPGSGGGVGSTGNYEVAFTVSSEASSLG